MCALFGTEGAHKRRLCVIGQLILNYLISLGINKVDAGSLDAIIMVFLGALLTGLEFMMIWIKKPGRVQLYL